MSPDHFNRVLIIVTALLQIGFGILLIYMSKANRQLHNINQALFEQIIVERDKDRDRARPMP